jgi:CubicO group peptidase (beta-lactamase class C family)
VLLGCQSWQEPEYNSETSLYEKLNLTPAWTDNLLKEIKAKGQDTMSNDWIKTACDLPISILKTPRLLSLAAIRDQDLSKAYAQLMIEPVELCDTNFNFLWVDNSIDTTVKRAFFEETITLASNPKRLIPITNPIMSDYKIIHIGRESRMTFDIRMNSYAWNESRQINRFTNDDIKELKKHKLLVITLNDPIVHPRFYKNLKKLNEATNVILVNFGNLLNLKELDKSYTVVQVYEKNEMTEDLVAQHLFGAIAAKGQLPTHISSSFDYGQGDTTTATNRLAYGMPQDVGINAVKLKEDIDKVMARAIRKKATPGAQILVAKRGKIIFHQSYGYHTYDKEIPVNNSNLYDLASITKVAATTLAMMKLYDEGKITDVNNRLSDYFGEMTSDGKRSTIKRLRLRYLLTHRSGLPVGFPILQYVRLKDQSEDSKYWNYFSRTKNDVFNVKITDDLYLKEDLQESVWQDVQRSKVRSRGKFQYSDVNFFILQKLIEQLTNEGLDDYVEERFYEPLGLPTLTYNPLLYFQKSNIIPTAFDKKWRKQLLQGEVQDDAAAFMNGVGGHAGLFGRAEDLAVIGQLLLNGGTYGGERYFKSSTIDYFRGTGHGNHRGLGFDRNPKSNENGCYHGASKDTYGHSGYTGTAFWIDPDNELVYVFLSNRVHTNKDNERLMKLKVREMVHRAVYKAML